MREGLKATISHGPYQPLGIHSLRSQGQIAQSVANLHSQFPDLVGVIQEGTGYGSLFAVSMWRQRDVRMILVPANIESLAPNTNSWTHQGLDVSHRFANERRWWALADAVFTISVEAAWWLQLHGIEAEWLPYYPAPLREQQLLEIRQQRQPDPDSSWLWLADFRNPANRAGVPITLKWLEKMCCKPGRINVVGRGVEWLQRQFQDQLPVYVCLVGEVSDGELDILLKRCTTQLIVHPASSGMLTRVVDASIAGIGITGNSMATKSYSCLFADGHVTPSPKFSSQVQLFLSAIDLRFQHFF